MPQMSPISWLNLLMMTSVTMMIMNTMIFFKMKTKNYSTKMVKKKKKNWLW